MEGNLGPEKKLNIPENAFKELEALTQKNPRKEGNQKSSEHGPRYRFNSTVLAMITIGLIGTILNQLSLSGPNMFVHYFALFHSIFTLEWFSLHGSGLTRQRRAFLNVKNVLDTYQIWNRQLGHLFKPEPDTPGFSCCCPPPPAIVNGTKGSSLEQGTIRSAKDASFDKAIQDHYGGMYNKIKEANAETSGHTTYNDFGTPAYDAAAKELVPADIPIFGAPKKSDDQQKKE